ncbi:hypothetical protein JCM24511_05425 [Saitozyma sp. JCM 24511]|nr:hypothetical protein JCM24511_05425 [Saitozyma sp. JCM 24511]
MSTTSFPDVPLSSDTSFDYEQPKAFMARRPDVQGARFTCQPYIPASLSGDTMEFRFCVRCINSDDADLSLVDEYTERMTAYGISPAIRQAWTTRLSGTFNLGELVSVSRLWADHVYRSMVDAGKNEGEPAWSVTLLWEDVPFMPSGSSNPAGGLLSPVNSSVEDRLIIEPAETTLQRPDGGELDMRTNILIYPDPANPTQPTFQAFARYLVNQSEVDEFGEGGRWASTEALLSQTKRHDWSQGLFHGTPQELCNTVDSVRAALCNGVMEHFAAGRVGGPLLTDESHGQ